MYRTGVDYMQAVNEAIIRVATSPGKKITEAEARGILKDCGIMGKNNQIKSVYKKIIVKSEEAAGERE